MATSMYFSTLIYCVCEHEYTPAHVEAQRTTSGISPPFAPCGFWGLNSGLQVGSKCLYLLNYFISLFFKKNIYF